MLVVGRSALPSDAAYPGRYAAALLARGRGHGMRCPEHRARSRTRQTFAWDGVESGGDGLRTTRVAARTTQRRARWEPRSHRIPANQCEGDSGQRRSKTTGRSWCAACTELVALEPGADRWRVLVGRGEAGTRDRVGRVREADGALLVAGYAQAARRTLLACRDRVPKAAQRAAWDMRRPVRCAQIELPVRPRRGGRRRSSRRSCMVLLSPDRAAAKYEDRETPAASRRYGPTTRSFEVVSVEGDERRRFEVVIRLERKRGTPRSCSSSDRGSPPDGQDARLDRSSTSCPCPVRGREDAGCVGRW